jgi:hypothetical protein
MKVAFKTHRTHVKVKIKESFLDVGDRKAIL